MLVVRHATGILFTVSIPYEYIMRRHTKRGDLSTICIIEAMAYVNDTYTRSNYTTRYYVMVFFHWLTNISGFGTAQYIDVLHFPLLQNICSHINVDRSHLQTITVDVGNNEYNVTITKCFLKLKIRLYLLYRFLVGYSAIKITGFLLGTKLSWEYLYLPV